MPGMRQITPYLLEDDHVVWVPPAQISTVPVASITYTAGDETLGANLQAQKAVASAGATAIMNIDLSPDLQRLTPNCGVVFVKDVVLHYAVLTAGLTGAPTGILSSVTFGAIGAAASAPTVAVFGGVQSYTPASWPTATSAAGQTYNAKATFATGTALNTDLQKIIFRVSFPMANTGIVLLAGCFVHFNEQIANA